MPDSLELRKRKAKAKAQAARSRGSTLSPQPEQTQITQTPTGLERAGATAMRGLSSAGESYGNAFEQFTGLGDQPFNPVAGVFNASLGTAKALSVPLNVILDQVKSLGGFANQAVGIIEKPIGALGGLVGGGVESGIRGVGGMLPVSPERVEQVAQPAGELANIATQGVVTGGLARPMKSAKALTPRVIPERLMASALQPSISKPLSVDRIVSIALQEKQVVSKRQLRANAETLAKNNETVRGRIQQGASQGDTVPVTELTDGFDAIELRASKTANPEKARADIQTVRDLLEKHESGPDIPVDFVQGIKQDLQGVVGEKFSPDAQTPPKSKWTIEAEKKASRNARMSLEKRYPDIVEPNKVMSDLMAVDPVLRRAVARHWTSNVIPISPFIAGAAGGVLSGGDPTIVGVTALAKILADQPFAKSHLAKGLYRGKDFKPPMPLPRHEEKQ